MEAGGGGASMKTLVMIIHADARQEIGDRLRGIDRVNGFTVTRVEGHGTQEEALNSATDNVVGYVPQVRVEILLEDEDVDGVLKVLGAASSVLKGQGVYWIAEVGRSGRL